MITGPLRCPACGHMMSLAEMSRQSSSKVERPSSLVRATVNLSAFPAESLSGQDNADFSITSGLSGQNPALGSGKETVDFGAYIAALEDLIPDSEDGDLASLAALLPPSESTPARQTPAASLSQPSTPEPAAPTPSPVNTPTKPTVPYGSPSAAAMSFDDHDEDEFELPPLPSQDSFVPPVMTPPTHLPPEVRATPTPSNPLIERSTTAFSALDPATALGNVGLFDDFEDELPELPDLPDLVEAEQEKAPAPTPEPEIIQPVSSTSLPQSSSSPVFENGPDYLSDDDFLSVGFVEEPLGPPDTGGYSSPSSSAPSYSAPSYSSPSYSTPGVTSTRPTPDSGPMAYSMRDSSPSGGASLPNQSTASGMQESPRVTQRSKPLSNTRPPDEFLGPQQRKRPLQSKVSSPARPATPDRNAPLFDDLLQEFMETEVKDEMSQYHYKLQMNDKVFEHLKEEDILSLLESQQLTGDEKASLQLQNDWRPLREFSDFRPTIALLESEGRLGSRRSSASLDNIQAPDAEADVFEAIDEPAPIDPFLETVVDQSVPKQPLSPIDKLKHLNQRLGTINVGPLKIPVLFLSGGASLLMLLLLLPGLFSSEPSSKNQPVMPRKEVRQAITVLSGFNVARSLQKSRYRDFKYALDELKKAGRDATQPSLRKIRAAYYLLDQFGLDAPIADDIELITNRFLKKASPVEKQRIALLQALTRAELKVTPASKKGWLKHLPANHEEWGYLRARLFERSGETAKAELQYSKLLKRYPVHIPALLGHARLLYKSGKEDRSMLHYKKVLKQAPRHVAALLTVMEYSQNNPRWKKLLPKSSQVLGTLIKNGVTSASTARWHYIKALELWRQGQFAASLKKLNEAYTYDRNNRLIRIDRIRYHLWAGKHTFAKRILKEELSSASNNAYLKLLQIEVNIRLRQFRTASYQLRQLLKRSNRRLLTAQLYFLQGQLNETRGYVKRAVKSYKKSLKYMPKGTLYPGVKALLTLMLLQQQPREVLKTLRNVTRSYKSMRPYFRYIQTRAYIQLSRTQEAIIATENLRTRYPRWSRGFELEGRLKLAQGRPWKAMNWFRQAIVRQARNPLELRFLMSYTLLKKGDFSDVILLHYRQQREKQSQIPNTCYSLGLQAFALYAQGRCSELRKLPLRSAYCAEPYLIQARCALRNDSRRRAMRYFQRAVSLAPKATEPIWSLSQFYVQQRQWRKLRPSSLVALRSHPQRNQLATRLLKIIPAKYNRKALRFATNWRDKSKFYLPLELEALRLQIQLKGQRSARKPLKQLLEKLASTEAKAKFLANLGASLVKHNASKEAIPYYAKALVMLPTASQWRLDVAELYAKTGNFTYCKMELRSYLQSVPVAARPKARLKSLRTQCKLR